MGTPDKSTPVDLYGRGVPWFGEYSSYLDGNIPFGRVYDWVQ